jgi:hypothetical protein
MKEVTTIQWSCDPPLVLRFGCSSGSFGLPRADRAETEELGLKCAAKLLLLGRTPKVVVPSTDEMVGLALLERDDELPNRRRAL